MNDHALFPPDTRVSQLLYFFVVAEAEWLGAQVAAEARRRKEAK